MNAQSNSCDAVRDLIHAGGGGGSGLISSVSVPLSISNGNLSINLSIYITSSAFTTTLSGYTATTNLNAILSTYTNTAGINTILSKYTDNIGLTNLLANKQDLLTSGAGISISNNSISGLTLQVHGITQNATTCFFIQTNALLSSGVLNVNRLTHYDQIPLIYSTSSSITEC